VIGPPAHSYPETDAPVRDAFLASLRRSRERRAIAARLRTRRRRTRGGSGGLAAALALVALCAPLALAGNGTGGQAAGLLTAGSQGNGVSAVQRALGVLVTGRYDSATRRAVLAFQRSHGLIVDGIVGPQTRAALGLASAPASTARAATSAPSATLQRIAECESGGNPQAVSSDGQYRGKYQFSRATWRSLGGTGDPAAAPEATQDRLAAQLLAQSGTSPWPNCG
jgi:hypothetical protein